MKCSCCGKRKRLLESFARVVVEDHQFNLCAKCNDYMYKIRDFAYEKDYSGYKEACTQIQERRKKGTIAFVEWSELFIEEKGKSFGIIDSENNKKNEMVIYNDNNIDSFLK